MHRFYCRSKNISPDTIIIDEKERIHHIKDVLRLKLKETVYIFDEWGNEYTAEIKEISPHGITLKAREKLKCDTDKKIKIIVACAIPKKSKMDDIVDKLTQLGVEEIIPLKTGRVVVRWGKDKEALRISRLKKISQMASQQSQRRFIPKIEAVKGLSEIISASGGYDLKLIPALSGERKSLRQVFDGIKPRSVLVLIGPEGDFTPEEVSLASGAGFIPITLGKQVLRVETAAVAVVSFIKLYAGN